MQSIYNTKVNFNLKPKETIRISITANQMESITRERFNLYLSENHQLKNQNQIAFFFFSFTLCNYFPLKLE